MQVSFLRGHTLRLFICTCAFLLVANPSYAEFISGSKFDYSTNEFFTPASSLTYGTPSVTGGDTLAFGLGSSTIPLQFSSYASGQDGVDSVDGKLSVVIQAHLGVSLRSLNLYEYGVYQSLNLIGGPGTSAGVAVYGVTLQILDIQGGIDSGDEDLLKFTNLTTTISDLYTPPAFLPQPDAKIFQKVPGQYLLGGWQANLEIDINDLLPEKYKDKSVYSASLIFDNILSTTSEAGTCISIDKKLVEITCVDVPEPSVLIMLAAAVGLGLGVWWRKK